MGSHSSRLVCAIKTFNLRTRPIAEGNDRSLLSRTTNVSNSVKLPISSGNSDSWLSARWRARSVAFYDYDFDDDDEPHQDNPRPHSLRFPKLGRISVRSLQLKSKNRSAGQLPNPCGSSLILLTLMMEKTTTQREDRRDTGKKRKEIRWIHISWHTPTNKMEYLKMRICNRGRWLMLAGMNLRPLLYTLKYSRLESWLISSGSSVCG